MKRKLLYTLLIGIFFGQLSIAQGCIRITGLDPAANVITITNTTGSTVDISDYRLCSLFSYTNGGIAANTTIFLGNPASLPNNDILVLGWDLNDIAADLALYEPTGAFTDPNAMVDFMQYGSSGNGREPEAVAAGLWTAGEFVPGANTMVWIGTCTDHSASNWITTGVEDLEGIGLKIGPNPVHDILTISSSILLNQAVDVKIFNVTGSLIKNVQFSNGTKASMEIDTGEWQAGVYFVQIFNNGDLMLTEKVVKNE